MKQLAEQYISQGWQIIATDPATKKALHKWKDGALADAAIWNSNPTASVALMTGRTFFVVDVDVKDGKDGPGNFARLGTLPVTYTVRTPSGGFHYYFLHPGKPVKTSAGELAEGVDVRGEGGYVLAAGNVRPADGQPYAICDPSPIAIAPPWLVELVCREAVAPAFTLPGLPGLPAPTLVRDPAKYAATALANATAKIVSADNLKQDDTFNREAHSIGLLVRNGTIDADEAQQALLTAGMTMVNFKPEDPWTERGLMKKINRAFADAASKPVVDPFTTAFGNALPVLPSGASATPSANSTPTAMVITHGEDVLVTENAMAETFTIQNADELRWVEPWGRWIHWNGVQWKNDETRYVFDAVRRLCEQYGTRARDNQRSGDYKKILSASTFSAVERIARSRAELQASPDQWDADPMLLNTPGGVVDLNTGHMRAAQPDDYLRKCAAVTPGGDCPTWHAFLQTTFGGDVDMIRYIQRVAGYMLTGQTIEQALFFGHGTGGNGKSVIVDVFMGILADYAVTAAVTTFEASKNTQHTTELAKLAGARLVTASETSSGRGWNEERIKMATGDGRMVGRFMRQDDFEFKPQFKLLIVGNHKPQLQNVDYSHRRRFHLWPFLVTIPKEHRDAHLGDRLKAEWSGILAWAIEGCLAWQREGLAAPKAVIDATEEYLNDEDIIARWVDDRCTANPGYKHTPTELYGDFRTWLQIVGEFPVSQKKFSQKLMGRIDIVQYHRDMNSRGFYGLELKHKLGSFDIPPPVGLPGL